MEKGFAEVANRVSDPHQRPELNPVPEPASIEDPERSRGETHKEKIRGEHCLNVYVSYELKGRLAALAEKYDLSLSGVIRQVIKAGIPVFESLVVSQEELISGFVQLLRKSRSMGELKK